MLKIKIVVVGRTRPAFLKSGEGHYLDRLKRYAQARLVEVKPVRVTKGRSPADILGEEGRAISKRLLPREYVIALDRSGKMIDSETLARLIEQVSLAHPGIAFVTGGPFGLAKEVIAGAHEVLSLSRLTLTHEMVRLFLLEQLYRAFTIIKGEGYHK